MKYKLLFLVFICNITALFAQTLPVGMLGNIDDFYRRQQVLGNDTSKVSYMVRPLYLSPVVQEHQRLDDSPEGLSKEYFRSLLYLSANQKMAVYALPVVWQNQFNSHHPYGINDGAMIGAKGYQTLLSAGIYARFGPLSVQFKPEVVFAQNAAFQQIEAKKYPASFNSAYKSYYNKIDLPERFGTGTYHQFNLGQSSIRLNFGPASIGVSNENLWWGPGFRNALLMTNNAGGFKHATLNTTRPIATAIGSFEAQIIGGKLEQSGVVTSQESQFVPKAKDWRYLSGIIVTYQPKWLPGLYLGFDRSYIVNASTMGHGFSDYFPFLSGLEKSGYQSGTVNLEDSKKRDQYISFFAKWVMPEAKSEVYLQWGRNDHAWDLRDLAVEPEHTRAYVAGFRKLVPFRGSDDEFIQLALEFTQLEGSSTKTTRFSEYWYSHYQVTDGYTNKGQVIGAGVGPGGNMQSFDISWVKGFKRLGVLLERSVHQNDLYYAAFPNTIEPRRHWVDLDATLNGDWTFGQFLVSAQLGLAHSLNYQYRFENPVPNQFWVWDKYNANNFHAKVGLVYTFN
ncbi:hypothetical protein GM921_10465 [Pedobacter sp. LMG 31464]|uniref:Capsule assembly protein Wzi n=1 Tax=Pedobacter planticolens TaxID=2679964 RepID=A0A923DXL9_9SPHI|nr:capsule assembly Wzi family protein [Pedobacter planticolens]MBB2145911.1 hypothetical protein [Pedobacter planticolens]